MNLLRYFVVVMFDFSEIDFSVFVVSINFRTNGEESFKENILLLVFK